MQQLKRWLADPVESMALQVPRALIASILALAIDFILYVFCHRVLGMPATVAAIAIGIAASEAFAVGAVAVAVVFRVVRVEAPPVTRIFLTPILAIAVALRRGVNRLQLGISACRFVIPQRCDADLANRFEPDLADVNVGARRIFRRIAMHDGDAPIVMIGVPTALGRW